MSTQSTLPFAPLSTPVKSPRADKHAKRELEDDVPQPELKKKKPNLPSPEADVSMMPEEDADSEPEELNKSAGADRSDIEGESGVSAAEQTADAGTTRQPTAENPSVDDGAKSEPEVEEIKSEDAVAKIDEHQRAENTDKQGNQARKRPSRAKTQAAPTTNHTQAKQLLDQKARQEKENEKETKRLKIEEEKKRKELKKKEAEDARLEKKRKIEEEKNKRREEAEARKAEAEKKKQELERQKEERRKQLEAKKLKQEQEKEEKRLKLEQEKVQRQQEREMAERKKREEKEAAERKKREEEDKKNRAQTKIASFFKVKKVSPQLVESSPIKLKECPSYSSTFLAFFVKENAKFFQGHCLSADDIALNNAKFDTSLTGVESDCVSFFASANNSFDVKTNRTTAFDVVQAINNNHSEAEIMRLVNNVPRKFFSFYENARPAYSGTGSKTIESIRAKYGADLSINPFAKINDPTIDYTYDSDLEWNPEEDDEGEGEELDDEEMSANEQSDEEEDYTDFLEDDKQLKKNVLIGPLIPVIRTYNSESDGTEDTSYFHSLALEPLKLNPSICPFEDYWSAKTQAPAIEKKGPELITISSLNSSVQPAKTQPSPLEVNTNTVNVLTGHKKPKKAIVDREHLLQALKLVASHNDYSLQTLKEMTSRALKNKYSYAIVDETIKKYFYKKDNKTYELKDANTIQNLENLMKGAENSESAPV